MTHILVVDDDNDIRRIAELALGTVGNFTVSMASSGAEAIAFCTASLPDVVLLDVQMPDMNGIETLAAIKKAWPGLQVVFLTAKASAQDQQELLNLGAVAVLAKPFNPMTLAQQVHDALANAT